MGVFLMCFLFKQFNFKFSFFLVLIDLVQIDLFLKNLNGIMCVVCFSSKNIEYKHFLGIRLKIPRITLM